MEPIPFNRPQLVGREHAYIDTALASGKRSGNGVFAERCARWLEQRIGARRALVTPSCTAALEMSGILAGLNPGDEVIVPSFTFVSTANAFALRGAVPVFVDIDPATLNIDPEAVAAAVTERTRAVVVVHYGGVACENGSSHDDRRAPRSRRCRGRCPCIAGDLLRPSAGVHRPLGHSEHSRDEERAVRRGRRSPRQ